MFDQMEQDQPTITYKRPRLSELTPRQMDRYRVAHKKLEKMQRKRDAAIRQIVWLDRDWAEKREAVRVQIAQIDRDIEAQRIVRYRARRGLE